MNFTEISNITILIFLLWIVTLLLFYYFYRAKEKKITFENAELNRRVAFLENELFACRKKLTTSLSNPNFETKETNKGAFKDDLKVVEGIGPKIESLLHKEGIFTFLQLSAMSAKDIKKILEKAGTRFQMHDPTTWAKQAELANEGKWDALKKWQAELDKGRIV